MTLRPISPTFARKQHMTALEGKVLEGLLLKGLLLEGRVVLVSGR